MAVISTPARTSPYVGLTEFGEGDAAVFFGREREVRILTSNVLTSRLTVLYAPSGVGKSSLLAAGILARLHAMPGQPALVYADWHAQPLHGVKAAIARELARLDHPIPPESLTLHLDDILNVAGQELNPDVVVILDQFEEYILYNRAGPAGDEFEADLARALNRRDCPAHFLIAIREDVLAGLDALSGRAPGVLTNRVRLEPLTPAAAREAIVKPIAVYNEQHPEAEFGVESELIDALLDQVRAEGPTRARSAIANMAPAAAEQASITIDASSLQLVLRVLWDAATARGARQLRADTLRSLGGVGRIIQDHLRRRMDALNGEQREIAARVFHFLAAPLGRTNAYTAGELATYAEVPTPDVRAVLERLTGADARILRAVAVREAQTTTQRYEMWSDAIGAAAYQWRLQFVALGAQQWRLVALALAVLAVVVAFVAVIVQPPNRVLPFIYGAAILGVSCAAVVQVYRWFLRYVSMSGFLSMRTYRSPAIGIVIGVLLTILWFVSNTRVHTDAPDWLWAERLKGVGFAVYLFTVLPTIAVAALIFTVMQFCGQVTAALFERFDTGLYFGFAVACLILVGAIALELANILPGWVGISNVFLQGA